MSTPPFVHLHCHSHYSLLDGASEIGKLVERAKGCGMNALALTDHGNLHGALEFYTKAKAAGINPILGYEAYIAPDSRFKKDAGGMKEASYHLTLLAQNKVGFRNLVKMASAAFLEGFYFKPRIDKELLEQYHEGIICLSGCVSSEFSRAVLKHGPSPQPSPSGRGSDWLDEAKQVAAWFQGLFGDRYFIEIQNNGVEIQRQQMEGAVRVAREMGLPLVCTSDAHYVNQEDAEAQDVLLCINTGKYRTDTNRMRMEGNQFFLRSPEQMHAAFPGFEEALKQSQLIADSVNIELDLGQRHFPTFSPPEAKTPSVFLRELCLQGLRERYANVPDRWADCGAGVPPAVEEKGSRDGCTTMVPDRWAEEKGTGTISPIDAGDLTSPPGEMVPVPFSQRELAPDVLQRLDRELGVIDQLGFPNYFLIVWDFVRYSREKGIPATARGSGVGSLVSYALYLSHVCPLRYDLLFERFLDINRLEAPDIDIDFCKDRRGEVIQYVKDKYGAENVAQIGTFGTLAARAAIRDVGRAMGMPIARVDTIVAMVPDTLGIELAQALEQSSDLKKTYDADPQIRELLDLAMKIEGLARNVGTHAAAVVIADRPLTDYVPLQRVTGKDEVITQWAMGDVERAGLLKMDFLGLRNLTVLSKAVDLIEQTTGARVDPYQFPLDDQPTFDLLCRGETKGIFQLESGGIRDLLQKMKPDHFRDIIATNALYRPGPLEGGMVDDYVQVKHGRKEAQYLHPVMKEILEETHGVMVYQEQVMLILNRLGDIELSSAYSCIKAISKKQLPKIAKFHEEFVVGARNKGLTKQQAEELFGMIEKFAGYGFNKSHSTAYALLAYATAYLKAHHPIEFMAALLSGDIAARNFKKKDPLVEHIEDCRRMNIDVVPPDVNRSSGDFTVGGEPTKNNFAASPALTSPLPEGEEVKGRSSFSSAPEGKIYFGLSAIKGCGSQAADAIVAARKAGGPFRDLFDFCERVDTSQCSRAAIESLIKAGAFDQCGGRRAQFAAVLERAIQSGAAALANRRSGQKGLFDDADEPATTTTVHLPDVPEWSERERLCNEKEVLGFYLTSHPLAEHQQTLAAYCSHSTASLANLGHKTEVTVGGMLSALKFSNTKTARPGSNNTRYVMFDLEDMDGMVRCILWPEEFANVGQLVEADAILVVRGSVDRRPGSEEANLVVNELIPLGELASRYTKGVMITLSETQAEANGQPIGETDAASPPPADARTLELLREIVRGYPGKCELQLVVRLADGSKVYLKSESLRVEVHDEFRSRVDDLLGPGNFRLIAAPPTSKSANGRGNGERSNGGGGRALAGARRS